MMKKRTFMQAILTAALLGAGSNALADDWTTGTYVYDGSGNIVIVGADQYVYDKVNRLHSATAKGPGNRQEYVYDSFGNRLKSTTVHTLPCANDVPCDGLPLTVAPATNHVTSGSAAYDDDGSLAHYVESVYAADGHLVESDRAHDYVYDGAGMMSSQSDGGKKRQYIYTADDQRIAVYADQEWHWSVRDLDQRVVRDFTSNDGSPTGWTVNEDYIHSDQALLSSVSTSGRRYVHVDHLGTPRLITGDQRQFLGEHAYFPFGTELALTSEDPQERLKLTGHERDTIPGEPLSLDYMHARYYGGLQGRFLSVDPALDVKTALQNPKVWNRYAYVQDNPVGSMDPDGRLTVIVHGTFAQDEDWPKKGAFNAAVSQHFGEKAVAFRWSGGNSKSARVKAAKELKAFIDKNRPPGEPLNIVAHSHGGNVVKLYTQLKGSQKIDTFIALGTPQRSDYTIDRSKVTSYFNVYSTGDHVQSKGGPWYWTAAGRTDPAATNINVTDVNGSPAGAGHSELHTPDVLAQVP
jgi:RHS repeat-associated protein